VRFPYAALALTLGLLGTIAIEISSALLGLFTALTSWTVVDALIYMGVTLLLALLFAPLFRRSSGLGLLVVAPLFLLIYAPLTGIIAGLINLTLQGGWWDSFQVRGELINTPVNLIYTLVLELWFIAVPLGIGTVVLLWWRSRQARSIYQTQRPNLR
jgi:hypothetical protein